MKVNKLCKAILKLTDEDFEEVENMARSQKNYVHPLKYAKAQKIHDLGNRNLQIIDSLKNLKKLIEANKQ